MFKTACKHNENVIFYFDQWGNKHVATGGTLAWRIRNPGLIHKRTQAAALNGSIGSYDDYAIFPEPEQGLKALADWLQSKTCQKTALQDLAKKYRPNNPENFLKYIINSVGGSPTKKVGALSKSELQSLQNAICKLCGYSYVGDENFILLPKIIAKIENCTTDEDFYLISGNIILSKKEAVEWVLGHRLDAIIVHEKKDDNRIHLRSRPYHCMQHINLNERNFHLSEGQFEIIYRSIGEKRVGQCIWAFINGISNTKNDAIKSAKLISDAADGEEVLLMPNDRDLWMWGNFIEALIQKASLDTSVIELAVKFFRYLINLSEENPKHPPIIIFVHSQGSIIAEHALEHLKNEERKKLRIFSFGGGSFISTQKCHPDSHNYASATDLVPQGGAPNHQNFALAVYHAANKGESLETVINRLAVRDVILCFNAHENSFVSIEKFEALVRQREQYYKNEYQKLEITILEPECCVEHSFKNKCYQDVVKDLIKKCRNK